MLSIGKKIPAFKLDASDEKTYSNTDLLGKFSVFVIYPKNNTPG